MKRNLNRGISILLSVCMVLSILAGSGISLVRAESATPTGTKTETVVSLPNLIANGTFGEVREVSTYKNVVIGELGCAYASGANFTVELTNAYQVNGQYYACDGYALHVVHSAENGSAATATKKNITLPAYTARKSKIKLSASVRGTFGTNSAYLQILFYNEAGTTLTAVDAPNKNRVYFTTSEDWQEYNYEVTIPDDTAYVQANFYSTLGSRASDGYMDNVSLTVDNGEDLLAKNSMNSSFNDTPDNREPDEVTEQFCVDKSGWTETASGTIIANDEGDNAYLQLAGDAAAETQGAVGSIAVESGTQYQLTFDYMSNAAVGFCVGTDEALHSNLPVANDWTAHTITFTTGNEQDSLDIYPYFAAVADGTEARNAQFDNFVLTNLTKVCDHDWVTETETGEGTCQSPLVSTAKCACGATKTTTTTYDHTYVGGTCSVCGAACEHTYDNGTCSVCGTVCVHDAPEGFCTICNLELPAHTIVEELFSNGALQSTDENGDVQFSYNKYDSSEETSGWKDPNDLFDITNEQAYTILELEAGNPTNAVLHVYDNVGDGDSASITYYQYKLEEGTNYTLKFDAKLAEDAVNATAVYVRQMNGTTRMAQFVVRPNKNVWTTYELPFDTTSGYTHFIILISTGGDTTGFETWFDNFSLYKTCAHEWENPVVSDANCTNGTTRTVYCDCGAVGITEYGEISETNHSWDEGVIDPDATCTEDGEKTFTCTLCGETKTETVPATGKHTAVTDAAVAPTCTATGLTEGSHCSVCGEILVAQEVVDKLDHSYTSEITKQPTLNEEGVETFTCSGCGDTYTKNIPMLTGAVAEIGGFKYGTLAEALAAAESGDVVTLLKDATIETDTTLAAGVTYEIPVGLTLTVAEGVTVTADAAATLNCAGTIVVAGEADISALVYGTTFGAKGGKLTVKATGSVVMLSTWEGVWTPVNDAQLGSMLKDCEDGAAVSVGSQNWKLTSGAWAHVNHTYTSEQTKAPTCTETGVMTYTCACGDSYTEDIAVIDHSYNAVVTAPTCTEGGYTTYTCSACGHSYTGNEVDALDHTEETIPGKDATCTEPGLTEGKKCTVCGEILVAQEVVDKLDHSYTSEITKQPTLNEEGVETFTCSGCGDTYTKNIPMLTGAVAEINGYKYATLQQALDAAKNGETVKLLANVAVSKYLDVYTANNGATARNFTLDLNGYTITPADDYKVSDYPVLFVGLNQTLNITGEGKISSNKGVTVGVYGILNLVSGTIESTGNTEYDGALCVWHWEPGNGYDDCATGTASISGGEVAGGLFNEGALTVTGGEIDFIELNHKDATIETSLQLNVSTDVEDAKVVYVDGKYSVHVHSWVAADCDTPKTCSTCGDIVGEANGHSYNAVVTAPTCTEGGYTTYTCSACGDTYTADVVAATGHQYGGLTVNSATCTEDGYITITCNKGCGGSWDSRYDQEAKDYLAQYPFINVTAKGHTDGEAVKENEVTADCDTAGSYDTVVYCTVCGEEISRVTTTVDALGHSYNAVVTAPTCTAGGYTTYTCACGDSYIDDAVAALGHNYTSEITKQPTWNEEGVRTYTCSGCGATYTEDIPMLTGAVAEINGYKYGTLADAIADANAGDTIVLLSDVELTETLTIAADKAVTLDLNGKTISQTKEQTTGYQMILNDGNLTIKDSVGTGKISYTDSGNGGEYISDTIYNRGVLVINGGTIENLSSATVAANGYPHAVDNYSGIRDTSVTINGGTIYCAEYSAIRMFCVSATKKADLTINGGTIKGAVDMQNGTAAAALGTLTITGGTFETTANINNIRFANWNGGAEEYGITASITGGSFNGGITTAYVPAAANWNSKIISGGTFAAPVNENYCAEGFIPTANGDGTYGVKEGSYVAQIGDVKYETLADAIADANAGDTVKLLSDIALTESVTVSADKVVTLDLNGYTVSMADSSAAACYMIKNYGTLTIKDSSAEQTGKLTFNSTTPSASNSYSVSTIGNGGTLIVESGIIENTTNGSAAYAIDTLWYSSDVSATIKGGIVKAEKIAIRQVLYSATAMNTLNISGGTVTGGYSAAQTHNFSGVAALADVNISGGTLNGTYAYYTSYTSASIHAGTNIEISGGTFNGYVFIYNGNAGSNVAEFANVAITDGTFNSGVYVYTKDAEKNEVSIGAISGGVFAEDATDYCVDGYHTVANAEGKYIPEKHTYKATVADPTCTEDGYTTYTCACGDSYTADVVAALGHSYVDGTCSVCGASEGPITDANLTFLGGAAISFQDYIGMNILFYNGTAADYDKFYVKAVQIDPELGEVESICNMVPYSYAGYDYTIFEHPVMSWSMTEQVTLTLYAEKDGVVYVGQSITTSIQALALEKLATYAAANNTVNCAALVDMLNYGAAVQVNQKHFVESLPSAGDYASYGTATTPEFNATTSVTGSGIIGNGPSISMQAKVEFNIMYSEADLAGNTVKAFVDGEEVEVLYNYDAAPGWPIARIVIKANQMRSTFTIAVYDADGNIVSQVIETSIEACAQTHLGGANNDLVIALMRYGDSVAAIG